MQLYHTYGNSFPKFRNVIFNLLYQTSCFLDVLLMKIRSKTISYAAMKKTSGCKKKEKDLENSIQSLEAKKVLTENEN